MIRRIAATVAAVAMLLVLAVPVLAGGWADIVADAQTTTPPVAGRPIDVGFKVMQHGVTPAPWETASVHFLDVSSGDKIDVVATNDDPNGHFSATATLPHAGYWSWQVTLKSLESDHVPVTIAVKAADGKLPSIDPASMLAAIDRAKNDVRNELATQFGQQIDQLSLQGDDYRNRIATLQSQVNLLKEDRNKLMTRAEALENGGGGLPILAVVTLAVLSGAAAGFAMAWFAGRPASTQKVGALSPAPRGADPA
jgi:hypothetical protein